MKTTKSIRQILLLPIISIILFNVAFSLQDSHYVVPKAQIDALAVLIVVFISTYFLEKLK